MGLAEKRAAAEFETTVYPGLKKQIDEAAGFEVPTEVRWDTLIKQEKQVAAWKDAWPKLYFLPIVNAFKQICVDPMGKDALKETLKKIVVQDAKPSYSSYWASFDKASGTLTLDYQFTNVDDINGRADMLRKVVEDAM